MKIFLDDKRSAPDGFVRCFTVEKTLEFLKQNIVRELSLTYSLGKCINCGGEVQIIFDGEKFVPTEPFIIQYDDPVIELDFGSSSMAPGKNIEAIEDNILIPSLKAFAVEEKERCPHVRNGLDLLLIIEDMVGRNGFVPPEKISIHNVEDNNKSIMMNWAIVSIYKFHELNVEEIKRYLNEGF